MRRLLLFSLFVIVALGAVSWQQNLRLRQKGMASRRCISHLHAIALSLGAGFAEPDTKSDLQTAIRKVATEQNGYSFFRCPPPSGDWVKIHPLLYSRGQVMDTNEVALYCKSPDLSDRWIAITLAGKDIVLSNAPAWSPIPVWDLQGKLNQQ